MSLTIQMECQNNECEGYNETLSTARELWWSEIDEQDDIIDWRCPVCYEPGVPTGEEAWEHD